MFAQYQIRKAKTRKTYPSPPQYSTIRPTAARSLSFEAFHLTYTSPKGGSKGICSRLRLSTNHQHGALEVGSSDCWKCSSCWEGTLDKCQHGSTSLNVKDLRIKHQDSKESKRFDMILFSQFPGAFEMHVVIRCRSQSQVLHSQRGCGHRGTKVTISESLCHGAMVQAMCTLLVLPCARNAWVESHRTPKLQKRIYHFK